MARHPLLGGKGVQDCKPQMEADDLLRQGYRATRRSRFQGHGSVDSQESFSSPHLYSITLLTQGALALTGCLLLAYFPCRLIDWYWSAAVLLQFCSSHQKLPHSHLDCSFPLIYRIRQWFAPCYKRNLTPDESSSEYSNTIGFFPSSMTGLAWTFCPYKWSMFIQTQSRSHSEG